MAPSVVENRVLGALWGKSDAAGSMNLLVQHLLDAAAVAELMWDEFLAPAVRDRLDLCCSGSGRTVFALACGLHDVGKATPAFQSKIPALAAAVRGCGLGWADLDAAQAGWHHTLAGAHLVSRWVLPAAGWSPETIDWVWPLIAGHHGVVPAAGSLLRPPGRGNAQGSGAWVVAQQAVVDRVVAELGVDLSELAVMRAPRRAEQLALSGLVIMVDWVASSELHFPGISDLAQVSMGAARHRAARAWGDLGLRGGWGPAAPTVFPDQVQARFGKPARPVQDDVVALAAGMPAPGLLIVEAPMGEGKTEAALAAVEVFASRFGADGVFVGLPTQATTDAMFGRVRRWAGAIERGLPVGLLHGKRRFNRDWKRLEQAVRIAGVCDDGESGGGVPAEWFLGPKRGLLCAVTVGTIDQLLYTATRTRHVMLRFAGLVGRVVVLDEIHSYDVYMSQFLLEALRWLGDAGVPVVLLSATLTSELRRQLVTAYLQGALGVREVDLAALPDPAGYPNALAVCVSDGEPRFATRSSKPWRPSVAVAVQVLAEAPSGDGAGAVFDVLREALREGGCALVVRNTVGRAQDTYAALAAEFGSEVVLLHSRLVAGERADRTERVLGLLGAPARDGATVRPHRLVVVATQLAEQSFDIDVDVLISDLAPIDLLLQRIGRLHRHHREGRPRPVGDPRVIVTGMAPHPDGPPVLPGGSIAVYGEYPLLAAAALVLAAAEGPGWSVPEQIPALVASGYGGDVEDLPASWRDRAGVARAQWEESQRDRAAVAAQYLLAGEDALGTPTLAGLHDRSVAEADDDDVAAAVRDGDESIEVTLVHRVAGGYTTLGGLPLGSDGGLAVADPDLLDEVARSTLRLPPHAAVTAAARQTLLPLAGWVRDPWLRRCRALPLDDDGAAVLGGRRLRYSDELGLLDESRRPAPERSRG